MERAEKLREKVEERRNEVLELKRQLDEAQTANTVLQEGAAELRLRLAEKERELAA